MIKGFKSTKVAAALGLSAMMLYSSAQAAPWVDTSDIYLRADIQALADAGVISGPINTFPLMWSGIGADLAQAEPALLTPDLVDAFARVNFYYQNAVGNRGNTSIKVVAASDEARFQHFGSDYREKGQLQGSHEYTGERFSYKISASANYNPADDEEIRLDDSYIAVVLGNWIVTAGSVGQWWGPGFDSSLHKSNNARPMPSLMISRNNSQAFETPWLSWIGDWSLTGGVSVTEEDRYAPHTLLWNLRGAIKPFRQLEIGLSWTTQFCGEGQECSFNTAVKSITGQRDCRADNVDEFGCSNYGNQMAGFDVRYADTWFDVPVGLYLERTCEDSKGDPWQIVDCGKMVGADTRFNISKQQYKLFIEYTDTMVYCGEDKNQFNCFYEHSTYQSGSRYYGRAFGSTYDSDANVYALGLIGQFDNSHGFTSILRYAQLNKDGANRGGVWAPQPLKEDIMMLELSYRLPMFNGMLTLGGSVANSEFEVQDDDTQGTVFSTYEYKF
ncbi:capsule assembly Wzi family protein [Shewanella frigidimarina]|uniref:capsule assembly Wzi family protein n=1 Tax=Shewanella frigidimarina TaxID=56812 RepID=UPI000F4F4DC1|nr:capsule assembly Wzi family protein [Shewanella frigidimarina]RPA59718.1 capsule assembly Wzi family protein [Shewanella frigidimarina]